MLKHPSPLSVSHAVGWALSHPHHPPPQDGRSSANHSLPNSPTNFCSTWSANQSQLIWQGFNLLCHTTSVVHKPYCAIYMSEDRDVAVHCEVWASLEAPPAHRHTLIVTPCCWAHVWSTVLTTSLVSLSFVQLDPSQDLIIDPSVAGWKAHFRSHIV